MNADASEPFGLALWDYFRGNASAELVAEEPSGDFLAKLTKQAA